MTSSSPVEVLRAQVRSAQAEGHPIDPDFVLRLVDLIDSAEHRMIAHEAFAHDVDAIFDGPESVFLRDHRCPAQSVVGRLYRRWQRYATERGYEPQRRRS